MVRRMIFAVLILGALSLIAYQVANKVSESKEPAEELADSEQEELLLDEEPVAEIA